MSQTSPARQKIVPTETAAYMLIQRIELYKHRLVTLESSLNELASQEALPKKQFDLRMQHLHDMRQMLKALWENLQYKTPSRALPPEFAILKQSSYEETQIFAESLWERQGIVKELNTMVDQALKIQHEALQNRVSYMRSTLSLNKLGKFLGFLENKIKNLMFDERHLNQMIKKIFGKKADVQLLHLNDVLLKTFENLSQLESDIAHCQEKFTTMEQKLESMRSWLSEETAAISKLGPESYPFNWNEWPLQIDTPLSQVLKIEEEVLNLSHKAHQYHSIINKKNTGPVTRKIINERKFS